MTIAATCPGCGAAYNLNDAMEGKRVRCRDCQKGFLVRGSGAGVADDGPDEPRRGRRDPDVRRRPRERPDGSGDAKVLLWVFGGLGFCVLLAGGICAGSIYYTFY